MAGEIAIRFSVQNAEVVRQALQSLGKDGEKALQQLNAGATAPNRGLTAISQLIDGLKSQVLGLAVPLGTVGTALVGLGPMGIAAAAGIGLLVSAFNAAVERAEALADRARNLREAATTAGVTVEQFQALELAGQRVGVDADRTRRFLDRLTISVEELRRGSGALFDALARIDAGLVREVASATNTTDAIDALARAFARLTDAGQRNALTTAIGGRGSVGLGPMLEMLANAGGVRQLEEGFRSVGRIISADILGNFERTRREIQTMRSETEAIWNRLASPRVLEAMRLAAELNLAIARAAEATARGGTAGRITRDRTLGGDIIPGEAFPDLDTALRELQRRGRTTGRGAPDATTFPPFSEGVVTRAPGAAVELELMRRWASMLGDALTLTEQRRLRELELGAALGSNRITQEHYNRAIGAFSLQQSAAVVAARQRIGVATEEEMVQQRLRELQELRARGFQISAEEMARAERLIRREVRETADALQVRNSVTPGLTRLQIDAADLTKTLDQGLTGALRSASQSMVDMLKGTKSLSQGFSELAERIFDAIANALLMKAVVGPIAGAISSGLTTFIPSAHGNIFAGGRLVPFARGGVVTGPTIFPLANGAGLMGEAGPEAVMPLRRTRGGRLGVEAAGEGASVQINIVNNHPSARVRENSQSDGRGGRKTTLVIEEMVASAVARAGSQVPRAFAAAGAMQRL